MWAVEATAGRTATALCASQTEQVFNSATKSFSALRMAEGSRCIAHLHFSAFATHRQIGSGVDVLVRDTKTLRPRKLDQAGGHGGRHGLPAFVKGHVALRAAQGLGQLSLTQAEPSADGSNGVHDSNSSATNSFSQKRHYFADKSSGANVAAMGTNLRKAKVTAVHEQEAAQLRAIWAAHAQKLNQAEFGELFEIGNQSAVGQFLRGITPLSLKAAKGFARGLECSVADFSPRLAAEIEALTQAIADPAAEFALVQRAAVAVSAGHGQLVLEEGSRSALSFRRDFLRSLGVSEKRCVVVDVSGHSMSPTITDGAVLLVNRAYTEIASGQIYAFRLDGQLFVKRLHRAGSGPVVARSDNPDKDEYPDMHIDGDSTDFEMIGRAVWVGSRL